MNAPPIYCPECGYSINPRGGRRDILMMHAEHGCSLIIGQARIINTCPGSYRTPISAFEAERVRERNKERVA